MDQSTQISNNQTSNYDDSAIAEQAKNLTKAIFQHESNTDYNSTGDAGTSKGAGQWQSATWKAQAKDVLGDENAPMTPENQSVVAQGTIRKLIKSGKNAAQIAAIWNSGTDKNWQSKVGTTTINGQQIKYNVPQYVKSVTDLYQQYKNNPTSQSTQQSTAQQPKQDNRDFLQKASDIVGSIFPGQQVGKAIGTLGGYGLTAGEEALGLAPKGSTAAYDLSAPTPLQTAGDVAQGALTIGAGLPEAGATSEAGQSLLGATKGFATKTGVLGKVVQGAKLGGLLGATGAIAGGSTDVGDIAKQGLVGSVVGGGINTVGSVLEKAGQSLPSRLIKSYIPKINDETAAYAIQKGLASPSKMLEDSNASIKSLGGQLGSILNKPDYEGITVSGKDIYQRFLQKNPDTDIQPDKFFSEIKKLSGLKGNLVYKLATPEGLSLADLQKLNSEIGGNTFKFSELDTPEVKTGKQLGSSVYRSMSDAIKSVAKESEPIYNDLSKEYQLKNGLQRAVSKEGRSKLINLRDLVAITSAGVPGYIVSKALENPAVGLKTAGLISQLATPTTKQVTRGALPYLLKATGVSRSTGK